MFRVGEKKIGYYISVEFNKFGVRFVFKCDDYK